VPKSALKATLSIGHHVNPNLVISFASSLVSVETLEVLNHGINLPQSVKLPTSYPKSK